MKKKTAYTLTTGYYPKSVVFGVVKDVTLSVSIAIIIYFEITKSPTTVDRQIIYINS